MSPLATNRSARRDYEILETFEAGIVLRGFEVRAVKTGKMSLRGAFVTFHDGALYLLNAFIAPYQPQNTPDDYDPSRSRKLLLREDQIKKLLGRKQEKGLTIVPIKVYTKGGRIKVEIALAKGKHRRDRREEIRRRDTERDIARELRGRDRHS